LMAKAAAAGADVATFPEVAMCGYAAGVDMPYGWRGFDWDLLERETESVMAEARRLGIWVVLGSAHRLTGKHLPHNTLYAISPKGRIVERYDKRFCTGADLRFYSPGDHFSVFEVNGVRCGLLICYDIRFCELYREYKKLGVQLMFHSFYNARAKGRIIHTTIMRATVQAMAGMNYMFVSAPNACGYFGLWPSVFVHPDGSVAGQLRWHRAGVMVNKVDTTKAYYDASRAYRDGAMAGVLNSGKLVRDPRSRNRTVL
ncbi:MAG: carbon-nitrogen hydrolase family protein, partial [Phycisphaerae bacterium]|nr:carbon-nitrogen hydrolase family protein [Phycisphaerae bacterium]